MNVLKLNRELCDIAREELNIFFEDENYEIIKIGEQFKSKISENFLQNEVALIAFEEIKNLDDIVKELCCKITT